MDGEEERLRFVEGDVAVPPYPAWVQTDAALASVARLLRRFHEASTIVSPAFLPLAWSRAFPFPAADGQIICHLDLCLENIVFVNSDAIAFIDFDFAGPADRLDDVASFARMCVPIDDEVRRAELGWTTMDVGRRLGVVLDAYGVTPSDQANFVDRLDDSINRAEHFVRTRVERGEPNFVAMWDSFGGNERFVRRRAWFEEHRTVLRQTVHRST